MTLWKILLYYWCLITCGLDFIPSHFTKSYFRNECYQLNTLWMEPAWDRLRDPGRFLHDDVNVVTTYMESPAGQEVPCKLTGFLLLLSILGFFVLGFLLGAAI